MSRKRWRYSSVLRAPGCAPGRGWFFGREHDPPSAFTRPAPCQTTALSDTLPRACWQHDNRPSAWAWLVTGQSLFQNNFQLAYQHFMLLQSDENWSAAAKSLTQMPVAPATVTLGPLPCLRHFVSSPPETPGDGQTFARKQPFFLQVTAAPPKQPERDRDRSGEGGREGGGVYTHRERETHTHMPLR